MPAAGYVRLHRQIQDHWVWAHGDTARGWMDLVMLAAWEPHTVTIKGQLYTLERGDLVAAVRFLASRWCWGLGKTASFLARLQADEMLVKKLNGSGNGSPSVFHVVNYETYQSDDAEERNGSRNAGGTVAERLRNETKKGKKVKKTTTTRQVPLLGSNGTGSDHPWGTPEALVALYNASVPAGHPRHTVTNGRRKNARASLEQFPDREFWAQVFAEIGRSSMLRGCRPSPGHEHFRGDLDWLLAKGKDGTENAVKVAEGRYRDTAMVLEDADDDAP